MSSGGLRKNSKARSWVSNKISKLKSEGYDKSEAIAVALEEARRHKLLKNSGEVEELKSELEEAEEVSKGFHGREVGEAFDIEEKHQYRSELAQLGELVELEVLNENIPQLLTLSFNRDRDSLVRLSSSANRKQIFLIGGDQEINDEDLERYNPQSYEKDKISVGNVFSISYFADKHHLTGPKQQRKGTDYIHEFGEQTFKKQSPETKIAGGALPNLIYDRLNKQMELVGGIYEIRDEGIWD